ncbi:MAG: hypothetical protein J1E36_07335 [Eubacterium sp.]|nr:hypothetical protein [Eubacterium sp.]
MTKLKKLIVSGIAVVLAVSLTACNVDIQSDALSDNSTDTSAVKTGYSVISTISDVTETTLTIDSVCAAVLVDNDGKVIDCKIDQAHIKPNLTQNNGDVADLRTKFEKQEDYGLRSASAIQKEWYEQISAFEDFTKGKTADEIINSVDENGYVSDTDLKASCTIKVSDISQAVANAIGSAQYLGASETDILRLAVSTQKNNSASSDTNLQYDSYYAAVTLNSDGIITSCLIDASQAKCTIADGMFTVSDCDFATKKELKEDYGMKGASQIGKEWYEQAGAFEEFAKGKTAAEITAVVGNDGYSSDADLSAGCTIDISPIVSNLVNAMA